MNEQKSDNFANECPYCGTKPLMKHVDGSYSCPNINCSTKQKKPDWAIFFYQHLGYPIIETEEANEALNKAMEEAFEVMLKEAADKKQTVVIRVLNDTEKDLTVRLLPPNTSVDLRAKAIQPRKMAAVFVQSNKVFLKIWDGNTILLCEDGYEPK